MYKNICEQNFGQLLPTTFYFFTNITIKLDNKLVIDNYHSKHFIIYVIIID